jgi:hypothetical protein
MFDFNCHFSCAHGKLRNTVVPFAGRGLPLWLFSVGGVAAKVMDDVEGASGQFLIIFRLHAFEQIILIRERTLTIIKGDKYRNAKYKIAKSNDMFLINIFNSPLLIINSKKRLNYDWHE